MVGPGLPFTTTETRRPRVSPARLLVDPPSFWSGGVEQEGGQWDEEKGREKKGPGPYVPLCGPIC